MRGLHKRTGEIVRPDRALSLDVLKQILASLEREWDTHNPSSFELAMEGSFYLIAFCCALRGEEVVLADLYGIKKYWIKGERHTESHAVIALLGRFKGETRESYHLMPIVSITRSGLSPRKWIGRLLEIYQSKGINHGPLLRSPSGLRCKSQDFEAKFFEHLEFIKLTKPHLMSSVEDVSEEYGVFRERSNFRGSECRCPS
jgi:hypothetical protein